MSRTIGGPLTAHLASGSLTLAVMLRLDLADGTAIGITDHDTVLSFDLGDGVLDYSSEFGILPSAVSLSEGFDADNFELRGPISDIVTRAAMLGGRFNGARARLFMVNWASLGSGSIKIMLGTTGEARIEGGTFVLSIRSEVDKFNQTVGRLLTPFCNADFGDARCGFDVPATIATVTAGGDLAFTVDPGDTFADAWFNVGDVTFTSGVLAGTRKVEIFDWAADGTIVLFVPLVEACQVGDTLELRPGCLKIRKSDVVGARTCMFYENIANFRGFPDAPSSDQTLRYPVPGSDA
jgi:uncharacterized phage protein (TIGR02218 family)